MEKAIFNAATVAKYFIWKAHQESKPITNKKLQKLVYYAQAWNLAVNDKPLFGDDIEAWVHGPTVRALYEEFKTFGYNPINVKVNKSEIQALIKDKLLNEVWEIYGKYDGNYLEALTHNEAPWQKAREGLDIDEESSIVISQKSMKEYYKKLLKKTSDE